MAGPLKEELLLRLSLKRYSGNKTDFIVVLWGHFSCIFGASVVSGSKGFVAFNYISHGSYMRWQLNNRRARVE